MATDFQKGIRLILIINVPAAAGMALISEPLVRLIYQHGHATGADIHRMAFLLSLMVIGLPFFSVVSLTVRAFYAVKDTRTPVRVALVDFAINVGLTLLLIQWFGVVGIVLASTTSIIAQTLLLGRALVRRLPEMHLAPLLPSLLKVCAGTLGMAVVVWGGLHALPVLGVGARGSDIAAVAARVATRWSAPGAASTRACTSRTGERRARRTQTGVANCDCPPGRWRNITNQRAMSCATSVPRSSSTKASARSMPAVTPALDQTVPSCT